MLHSRSRVDDAPERWGGSTEEDRVDWQIIDTTVLGRYTGITENTGEQYRRLEEAYEETL